MTTAEKTIFTRAANNSDDKGKKSKNRKDSQRSGRC